MNFLQWLVNGLPVGFILFIWQIGKWAWSKTPWERKRIKYNRLCMEEAKHLVLLKDLIMEIQGVCVWETIDTLATIRTGISPEDIPRIQTSLNVRLSSAIERINNETAIVQKSHNRTVKRIEEEASI